RHEVRRYYPREDGHVTDRVIDTVFRGRPADYRLHDGLLDERPSILVTFGRVRTSGVNKALLSLLKNIDPIRYDVTVLVLAPTNALERELQEMIPTSVRQLVRIGTFPATAHRLDGNDRYLSVGLNPDGSFPDDEANVLRAAWQHAFGLSRFDYAIDFSGYSPFWPSVLLQGDVDKRAMWMHNDMAAEAGRGAHGDQFKHRGLPAVFTLYHRFDSLVSVSEALSQINATQLSDLAPAEKFTCAHNTVDVERTRSLGSGCDVLGGSAASDIRVDNVPLSTAAAQFVRAFPLEFVTDEVRRQAELMRLMPDREHTTTFVTAGRLSPEKNHDRMIRAFAEVHRQHPETRLLILGDGPLKADIELLVQRLGLGDVVRLDRKSTR